MAEAVGALPYARILVAFDGSPSATVALRRALSMAKQSRAVVTVLTVDEAAPRYAPGVGRMDQTDAEERAFHEELHQQAKALAVSEGVAIEEASAEGRAVEEILRYAAAHGVDLIALGHTGHQGLVGTLLGSTTRNVVDQARCDVLVAK
ncbi:MAG: universal stress protein [Chloroflexota bacterium]